MPMLTRELSPCIRAKARPRRRSQKMPKIMTPAMEACIKKQKKDKKNGRKSSPWRDVGRRLVKNKSAMLGLIVILILLTVFNFAQPHTDIKQLRITIPESLNYSDAFDDVMNKFTEKAELRKVKTTNMGTMFELSYNVVVKDSVNEKEFIDNLRMRNGNLNISLSVAENDNNNLN